VHSASARRPSRSGGESAQRHSEVEPRKILTRIFDDFEVDFRHRGWGRAFVYEEDKDLFRFIDPATMYFYKLNSNGNKSQIKNQKTVDRAAGSRSGTQCQTAILNSYGTSRRSWHQQQVSGRGDRRYPGSSG
jgi:hypothetical protein